MAAGKAVINPAMCDGSPFCAVKRMCPAGAVTQKNGLFGGTAAVDAAKCAGCGKCVSYCPHNAVRMEKL